ncbi:MAG: hypothetical protein Q4E37_00800 [Tissierellia bacterium]|nr:hypothetical protein [Tissierellia bacterium]
MKYLDGTLLTNEDLLASYPRRIEKNENYEIWQFPYVKNEVLYDEEDLVGIHFGDRRTKIFLISKFKNRLEDLDFIDRVIALVHDISDEVELEKQVLKSDISVEDLLKIMKA